MLQAHCSLTSGFGACWVCPRRHSPAAWQIPITALNSFLGPLGWFLPQCSLSTLTIPITPSVTLPQLPVFLPCQTISSLRPSWRSGFNDKQARLLLFTSSHQCGMQICQPHQVVSLPTPPLQCFLGRRFCWFFIMVSCSLRLQWSFVYWSLYWDKALVEIIWGLEENSFLQRGRSLAPVCLLGTVSVGGFP